jgi:hypothetical protein
VSPITLFVGLLILAFVGGIRATRGVGSAPHSQSGVEYVILGLVVGPHVLGYVSKHAVYEFEPLLLMGMGWLLAVRGAKFADDSLGELSAKVVSFAGSVACCALVYGSVRALAVYWSMPHADLLALGAAAVTAENARVLGELRVVPAERTAHLDRLHGMSTVTELMPMLLLAGTILFTHDKSVTLPGSAGLLVSVTLGAALGAIVAALIGARFEKTELWPILLGSVLLVVGTALRLDMPALTPAYLLGLFVVILSPHRDEIRKLMGATDRQLLLPALLLAGVVFEWPHQLKHWLIVAVAVMLRVLVRFILAGWAARKSQVGLRGFVLGTGALLRSSGISVVLGLSVFLSYVDMGEAAASIGKIVLTTALVSTLIGELFGFLSVRALVGDIRPSLSESEPVV